MLAKAMCRMAGPMTAIDVRNVSKSFPSYDGARFDALSGVSVSIEEGCLCIVGGENGSGKSLLMNIISGLEKPSSGAVEVSSKVGLVFQDADSQILGETPIEDVCFGLSNVGVRGDAAKKAAYEALRRVRLHEKANSPSHFLSGGEKRRLAIAAVLALGFKTLILDEPYSNLDYAGVKDVNALVEELHSTGATIVVLTHEIEKCLALADRFVVLKAGHVVFDGTPSEGLAQGPAVWNGWGIRNPLCAYPTLESLVWR